MSKRDPRRQGVCVMNLSDCHPPVTAGLISLTLVVAIAKMKVCGVLFSLSGLRKVGA